MQARQAYISNSGADEINPHDNGEGQILEWRRILDGSEVH